MQPMLTTNCSNLQVATRAGIEFFAPQEKLIFTQHHSRKLVDISTALADPGVGNSKYTVLRNNIESAQLYSVRLCLQSRRVLWEAKSVRRKNKTLHPCVLTLHRLLGFCLLIVPIFEQLQSLAT